MMEKVKVVTSGSAYLDIDAYAGCIAYAELLNLQGDKAKAVSTAQLNESITPAMRNWNKKFDNYAPSNYDEFVLIDVSNNNYLDKIVSEERVIEVIDHHPGFEMYWQSKLGNKADIICIGAACTQVYERWKESGLLTKISNDSARLLAAGILDNTLNFQAKVTTERDRVAYENLAKIAELSIDWSTQYFSECQFLIEANLEAAINYDAKICNPTMYLPHVFAQLAIWDSQYILQNKRDAIERVLQDKGDDWILNLVSIKDGKSYFLGANILSQNKFAKLLNLSFFEGIASSDRLWLRKEVMKQAIERDHS